MNAFWLTHERVIWFVIKATSMTHEIVIVRPFFGVFDKTWLPKRWCFMENPAVDDVVDEWWLGSPYDLGNLHMYNTRPQSRVSLVIFFQIL